ncbi:MAG: hypothetical protein QME96_03995 [Myxococcota bacterium]|nr:hypothetical protein [Myxococcota bacterium]
MAAIGCGPCQGCSDPDDGVGRPDRIAVEDASDGDAVLPDRVEVRDDVEDAGDTREAEALDDAGGEDAPEARDIPDYGDCGRDVQLWERVAGEEWCYEPEIRDLNPLRESPSPGCERVTFSGRVPAVSSWDVWNHLVGYLGSALSVAPGARVVDTTTWLEEVVEPWDPSVGLPGRPVDSAPLHPELSAGGTLLDALKDGASWSGTFVVYWDREARRKKMIYADPEVGTYSLRGNHRVEDFNGRIGAVMRDETAYSDVNLVAFDVRTLESWPITNFPGGGNIWNSQMWDDLVVLNTGGSTLHLASLSERTLSVLAPHPTYQYEPTIHGRRICWMDVRHGSGSPVGGYPVGEEVYCTDLDSGEMWSPSRTPGPTYGKRLPTVFGDWVAWDQYRRSEDGVWEDPRSPDGAPANDIPVYNHRLRRTWRVLERAEGFQSFAALWNPRLWGDYIYFLALSRPAGTLREVYRCELRVLFPEAFE